MRHLSSMMNEKIFIFDELHWLKKISREIGLRSVYKDPVVRCSTVRVRKDVEYAARRLRKRSTLTRPNSGAGKRNSYSSRRRSLCIPVNMDTAMYVMYYLRLKGEYHVFDAKRTFHRVRANICSDRVPDMWGSGEGRQASEDSRRIRSRSKRNPRTKSTRMETTFMLTKHRWANHVLETWRLSTVTTLSSARSGLPNVQKPNGRPCLRQTQRKLKSSVSRSNTWEIESQRGWENGHSNHQWTSHYLCRNRWTAPFSGLNVIS